MKLTECSMTWSSFWVAQQTLRWGRYVCRSSIWFISDVFLNERSEPFPPAGQETVNSFFFFLLHLFWDPSVVYFVSHPQSDCGCTVMGCLSLSSSTRWDQKHSHFRANESRMVKKKKRKNTTAISIKMFFFFLSLRTVSVQRRNEKKSKDAIMLSPRGYTCHMDGAAVLSCHVLFNK